jgi:hypothetical protein
MAELRYRINLDGGSVQVTDRGGVCAIESDLNHIETCQVVARILYTHIASLHGAAIANEIWAKAQLSKTNAKEQKNLRLLVAAESASASELAERNRTLPREERYGPSGTTDPATMATQINRLRKRYSGSKVLAEYKAITGLRPWALREAKKRLEAGYNVSEIRTEVNLKTPQTD